MTTFLASIVEFRDFLGTHVLFALGAMLLIGYLIGRLCGLIKLPEITGFIIAGIVVGESVLGVVPHTMTPSMKVITEVALGLIALAIGAEFSLAKLRRLGIEIVSMVVAQLVLVFIAVAGVLSLLGVDPAFAIILGSIATASSPAVIVAIVQNLRAHGTFVDYLYGIVALLDAGTVILFGISFSLAVGMLGLTAAGAGPFMLFLSAVLEVVFSLVAGAIVGLFLHAAIRRRRRSGEIMIITLGTVFIVTAVAIVFHLSPLLVNMTAGAVLINLSARHHRVFRSLEPLTPPIYALFFVLAGVELRLLLLMNPQILLVGGAYIVVRNVMKTASVYLGGLAVKVPKATAMNLGLCMFPQAGVALGLVLMVQASPFTAMMAPHQTALVDTMVNIVLLSVFVNQLVGPPILKRAIMRGNNMEE